MNLQWVRRTLPRRLFSRALLILLAPMLLLQAVVALVVIQRHFEGVTEQMAAAVALEIRYAMATVEEADTLQAARARLDDIAVPLGLFLTIDPLAPFAPGESRLLYDVTGAALADVLAETIEAPIAIDLLSDDKVVFLQVETGRGVLLAEIPRRRMVASNPHLLLVWMLVTSGVLCTIAILFLRNQIRPIRDLARAAEAFGKGRAIRFRPRGADEVRSAGTAFVAMRNRIERQIEQRTRMLSGVSHDLRTPLTRIRLALAMSEPSPETAEIARDVGEMERMLDAFLAFARGEGHEAPQMTDVGVLADRAVDAARRAGGAIALSVPANAPGGTIDAKTAATPLPEAPSAQVSLRPVAVGRALQNLLDNATTYGQSARLSVRVLPRWIDFVVEDDGPGIPANRREQALRAFTRLDEARNQNAGGGVGLGLAIALDIAHAHGGTLELGDSSALGGLQAVLRIPR
ncbi:MAG: ATP-binding protein [Pseudomonadota bacterium]